MVAHWQRIGPELDRIRRWELRNFNYMEHWAAIDALLQIACERAVPRTTSGLVELQRVFAKARRR
jgi:hypothetical protein